MSNNLKNCKSCSKEVAKSAKVCPHCGQKLKFGIGKIIGIIVLVLIILALFLPGESAPEADAPVFADLTCGDMTEEIGANEAAFVKKYSGKVVKITGPVDSINMTMGSPQVVIRSKNQNDFNFDSCMVYPKSGEEWHLDLQVGQTISVKCSDVDEIMGSVNLRNCRFLN